MFTQLRGYIIEDQGLINNLNLTFSHFGERKVNNDSVNRDCETDYHQPFYSSQLDIQLGNNKSFWQTTWIAKKPKAFHIVLGIK